MTDFDQAIDRYLNGVKVGLSISSYRNYKYYLARFREFLIDVAYVEDITEDQVLAHQQNLMLKLEKSTVFYHSICIVGFLRKSGRADLADKIRAPKYACVGWPCATKDHIDRMMKATKDHNRFYEARNRLMLKLLISSGIRISELVHIHLKDMDLKRKRMTIVSAKTLKLDYIFWDSETATILKQYLPLRASIAKQPHLLINSQGEGITTRQVQRLFIKLRDKAGIEEHIVPHSTRVGFINKGIKKNVHITVLQRLARHQSITSTEKYVRLDETDLNKAYRRVYDSKKVVRS